MNLKIAIEELVDLVLLVSMAKLKFEDVKKEIEEGGWELLSTTYSNLKTEMEMKCPERHKCFMSLEKWRRGKKCELCESNPYANMSVKVQKKTGYRILAFDQASITSGWSVFDDDKLMGYGSYTAGGNDHVSRVSNTKAWVVHLIAEWEPDLIIFEDIQLQYENGGQNVLLYKKLAALQGVLCNYCYEKGLPFKIVSSNTWREFNEIKGKSRTDRKKNAQIKVKRLYDVSIDNDSADAVMIGRWAAATQKEVKMVSFV